LLDSLADGLFFQLLAHGCGIGVIDADGELLARTP
jgi:hypothetical protein